MCDCYDLDNHRSKCDDNIDEAEEHDELLMILGNKQGRRFIMKMIGKMGVWRSSFTEDPLEMAFSEGQRNVGLMLLNMAIKHSPNFYKMMVEENISNER